jgi:Raf kinase inhibitor-like YbhB/YbcL family protein
VRVLLLLVAISLLLASCGGDDTETVSGKPPEAGRRLGVSSPHFGHGQQIPIEFTCDSRDVSPQLLWRGVSPDAAEVAILMEDPDAPSGTFVHWTAWGISPKLRGLPDDPDPSTFEQGMNSSGETGYRGPCPPEGDKPHRYEFHVYSLREPLGLKDGAEPQTVRQAIAKAAEAAGTVEGVYGR